MIGYFIFQSVLVIATCYMCANVSPWWVLLLLYGMGITVRKEGKND